MQTVCVCGRERVSGGWGESVLIWGESMISKVYST